MDVTCGISIPSGKEEDTDLSNGFFEFQGIRFSPKKLLFLNVYEGDSQAIEFTLQNVSGKPLYIHFEPPKSLAFTLAECGVASLLVPGFTLTNSVSFTHHRQAVKGSSIPVFVGESSVDYEIQVQIAKPNLVVTPSELDFGNLDMGSPAVTRFLTLRNTGSLGTKFAIDVGTNELEMNVMPLKGSLRAKTEVKVRFELVGLFEGEQCKNIWIRCQKMTLCVPVRIRVIQPLLEMHHPKTAGDFTLIDFPITYFDTQCHEMMVVRSISASNCMFVVLAEVNNELMGLDVAKKTIPDFNMFSIEPSEGRIEPFEGRIFTLNFYPKYDAKKERSRHEKVTKDFLVFLRIMRIHCTETIENEDEATKLLSMDAEKEISQSINAGRMSGSTTSRMAFDRYSITRPPTSKVHVARLCLHGEAFSPEIGLVPTMLDFGTLQYGTTHVRVLLITNLNPSLSITFKYCKLPFIEMSPSHGKIEGGKALEVAIKVTASIYGPHHQKLKINIFGQSCPMLQDPTLVKLDYYKYTVKFICRGKAILPAPVFNMGITPMVTNEVGKLTDGMKFGSAYLVPGAAMVSADVCKHRPWMKKQTKEEKTKLSRGKKIPSVSMDLSGTEFSDRVESKELPGDCNAVATLLLEKTSTAVSLDVSCKTSCEPCALNEYEICTVHSDFCHCKSHDMNALDSNLNKTTNIDEKTVDDITIKKSKRNDLQSSGKFDPIVPKMLKRLSGVSSWKSNLPDSISISEIEKNSGQVYVKHEKIEKVHNLDENLSLADSERMETLNYNSQYMYATPSELSRNSSSESGLSKMIDNISYSMDNNTLSTYTYTSSRDEINSVQLYSPKTPVYQSSSQQLDNKHISVSSHLNVDVKSVNIRNEGQNSAKIKTNKGTSVLNTSTIQQKSFGRDTVVQGTIVKGSIVKNKSEHQTTRLPYVHTPQDCSPKIQKLVSTPSNRSRYTKKPLTTKKQNRFVSEISAAPRKNLKFPKLASTQKLLSQKFKTEIGEELALDSHIEVDEIKPHVSSKHKFQLAKRNQMPELENKISSKVQHTTTSMPIEYKSTLKSAFVGGKNHKIPSTKPKKRKKECKQKSALDEESQSSMALYSSMSLQEPMPKVAVVQPVVLPDRRARVRQCATHHYMLQQAGSAEPQDALVALPNDRAQSLRPWPTGKIMRTIFTGVPRYAAPVDRDYAFTPTEVRAHQQHADNYLHYMRTVARQREHQAPSTAPEYQVAYSTLYQMMGMCQPQVVPKQEIIAQECSAQLQPKSDSLMQLMLPLTPLQLYNVKILPPNIYFGKVAPNCNAIELFWFENMNSFPVKIRMIPGRSGMSIPLGDTQILMPCQSHEVRMMYNAGRIGPYNGCMNYIINGNHSFTVTVTAEVVHKSLNISCKTLTWALDSMEKAFPSYNHFVSMKNPLQAYCKFSWEKPSETYPFQITPETGVVPPYHVLLCEVRYCPNYRSAFYRDMILHTEGGSEEHLFCKKIKRTPSVFFVDRHLNIHQIPLNLPRVFHTIIFNSNYEDMSFLVENWVPMHGCMVSPSNGIIRARSCLILELCMKVDQVTDIDFMLYVEIQQEVQLELRVIGSVEYPKVNIMPDVICLRRVSADSKDSMLVNFENNGTVEAIIQINMSEFPEFNLSTMPKTVTPECGENGFKLLPQERKDLYLIFNPIDVATYEFYLPIVINGLLGPPNIANPSTTKPEFYFNNLQNTQSESCLFPSSLPLVRVDCTVAGHILTFSSHYFNLALLPGNTQLTKTTDELRVWNEQSKSVSYSILLNEILVPSSPFLLQYKAGRNVKLYGSMIVGTLQPGEHTIYEVTFIPKDTGFFNAETPIHVFGYGEGRVFNDLFFRGLHPAPILQSEVSEIVFAPIPLCVDSTQFIYLEAYYHRNDFDVCATITEVYDEEMKCNLSDTLTLQFPNGNTIHGMMGLVSLVVCVTFRSERPVSFRTEIIFSDDTGSEWHVRIIATADNCLLSTHAFLRTRSDKYTIVKVNNTSSEDSSMNESYMNMEDNKDVVEKPSFSSLDDKSSVRNPETVKISTLIPHPPSICNEMTTPVLVLNSSNSSTAFPSENLFYSSISIFNVGDSENVSLESNHNASTSSNTAEANAAEEQPVAFPLYPSVDDNAGYKQHMDRTIMAAERWLYEQGYQCSFGAEIPRGLSAMMAGYYTPTILTFEKSSIHFEMKTIVNVLVNLMGPDVLKYFNLKPLPEETVERVQYQLAQHILLLKFLNKQGACLAHVKPKHLLTYADYLVHMDCKKDNLKTDYNKKVGGVNQEPAFPFEQETEDSPYVSLLTEEEFNRMGKQAWLDVVLQIAKTLHLNKVRAEGPRTKIHMSSYLNSSETTPSKYSSSQVNISDVLYSTMELCNKMNPLDSNVYSTSERVLLAWLNTVFNEHQTVLWNSSNQLQSRTIINFDDDLADGLVLSVVTCTYCPYLVKEYFGDLYLSPKTAEQAYHNAGCLITAWRAVRLGFTMYVEDIVHPNMVILVLLVRHLYSQLPTLYPSTTVRFNTPLTTQVTRCIQFRNPSNKRIVLRAEFIGDPQHFFAVTKPGLTIYFRPHERQNINIVFTARKITKVTAVLILCGCAMAPNFASNHTFRLEGSCSSLSVSATFNLSAPLYQPTSLTLPIHSPYKLNAEYEILCTESEPLDAVTFQAVPWRVLRLHKVPRRLFLCQSELLVVASENVSPLNITVACISPITRIYWLAFMHPDVGDFIIKLVVTPKKKETLQKLTTYFPLGWQSVDCQCVHPRRNQGIDSNPCYLRTVIKIPSRNALLWKSIATMFGKTLDSREKEFWNKHFETNIGLRLIQWMLRSENVTVSEEFQHIFNVAVTYNVTCSQPLLMRTEEQICIPDVRLNTPVDLPVHVSNKTPPNFTVKITLTSVDRMEIRNYHVVYQPAPELLPQSQEPSISNISLWNTMHMSTDDSSDEELTDLDDSSPP